MAARQRPSLLWLALGLVAALLPAQADEARQRLVAERAALLQRFAAEERACIDRFAVTACIDEVRSRQRAALEPLREQELRIDEVERQRRADERRAAVAQKQAELARRPLPPQVPELRLRDPAAAASASPAAPASAEPPSQAAAPSRDAAAEAAEAGKRARGLQEARERAEAAEARIRERRARQKEALAAKGRQPDSLPKPSAAASAPAR
jgi:colicin import membrane protein